MRHISAVFLYLALITLSLPRIAAAQELTAEQKAKVIQLLKMPSISAGADVTISALNGFNLEYQSGSTDEGEQDSKDRLADILLQKEPSLALERVKYWLQRGDARSVVNDEKAEADYSRAVAIAKQNSGQGTVTERARFLAYSAIAEIALKHFDLAEEQVKEALRLDPNAYEPYKALGRLRAEQILSGLSDGKAKYGDATAFVEKLDQLPKAEWDRVEKSCRESEEAFARAITLYEKQTNRPDPLVVSIYLTRAATSIMTHSVSEAIKAKRAGQTFDWGNLYASMYRDPVFLQDIERGAAIEADNPYAMVGELFFRTQQSSDLSFSKAAIAPYMTRLKGLYETKKHPVIVRTRALKVACVMGIWAQDFPSVEVLAAQGLKIAPKSAFFRDSYVGSMLKQDKAASAIPFLIEQRKTDSSPHWAMFLAKAYDKQNEARKAEEVLEPLYAQEKTIQAGVALAVTRLKQAENNSDPSRLAAIGQFLSQLSQDITPKTAKEWIEFGQTIAVYQTLSGQVERAKDTCKKLFELDKEDEVAKELMDILP